MLQNDNVKFFSLIILFVLTALFAWNGFDNLSQNKFKQKINLGLDLVGGSSLTLEADFSQYIDNLNDSFIDDIKKYSQADNLNLESAETHDSRIFLKYDKRSLEILKDTKIIEKMTSGRYKIDYRDSEIILTLNNGYLDHLKHDAIQEAMKNIQKRVDSMGSKEVTIQPLGDTRILLQAPGFKNPEELRYAVGKTAKLTFHMVDENADPKALSLNTKTLRDTSGHELHIFKKIEIDGTSINNAFATTNRNGQPVITFSLDQSGTEKFAKLSAANVGKRLAVVIDDEIVTAPVIREAIHTGNVEISGSFDFIQSKSLASSLRAGALPIKLNTIEEKTVGATLGDILIHSGKKSLIASFIIVTLFMVIVYGAIGLVASLAIIMNLAMILSLMIMTKATLSLAGIAGLVLTVGMVVDSNVLIFERIREELKKNPSAYISAIQIGFDRALTTIIDSNITTIIAAVLLLWFGDSNIKGFAITLTYGIIISFFTAVFFTKVIIQHFQSRILNYSFLLSRFNTK